MSSVVFLYYLLCFWFLYIGNSVEAEVKDSSNLQQNVSTVKPKSSVKPTGDVSTEKVINALNYHIHSSGL